MSRNENHARSANHHEKGEDAIITSICRLSLQRYSLFPCARLPTRGYKEQAESHEPNPQ